MVLEIDTQPGYSDPEALRDLVASLERYSERLNLHALVTDGRGAGAVVALACHTIHLVPGGRIGGVMPEPREDTTAEFAVILRRAAATVGELAQRHGTNPLIARAMIDPAQSVAVWRDADGATQVGPFLPSDTAEDQVLIREEADDGVLVVDSGQVEAAGRASAADAAALGEVLTVADWADQGDRGSELMAAEARKANAAAERTASRLQRDTDRSLDRRATIFDDYQHAMTMVAQYDPSGHSYETITAVNSNRRQWRRTGGIGIHVDDDNRSSTYDTNRFTRDSRNRRQRDIDITVGFLDQAIQAVTSMASLEKRADRAGVARAYAAEDLERVEQELRVRRQALAQTRNDRGR